MDFPAQAHPTRTAGGPATSWRRCCPRPSASRPPADGSWRCSAGASCGYPCPTAADRTVVRSTCPRWRSRARPTCRCSAPRSSSARSPARRWRTPSPPRSSSPGACPRRSASSSTRRAWSASRCRRPPWPSCAGPAAPRWTDPPRAAGSASSNRTGRTTRWTSSPPPPPSSPPPASSAPHDAAWPPSRPPTRSCSSASNSPTGRATLAPSPRRPGPGPRQGPSQDPGQPRPPGGGPGPGLRLDADERPPVLRPRPVTPAGAVPGGEGGRHPEHTGVPRPAEP